MDLGTLRGFLRVSEAFQAFQENSEGFMAPVQVLMGAPRTFQEVSEEFQGLSGEFRVLWCFTGVLRRFREFQGISGNFRRFQGILWVFTRNGRYMSVLGFTEVFQGRYFEAFLIVQKSFSGVSEALNGVSERERFSGFREVWRDFTGSQVSYMMISKACQRVSG